MSNKNNLGLVAMLGIALLGAGANSAHADIKPLAGGVPTIVSVGGGIFRYDYIVQVDDQQKVAPGSDFTFYDFGGYVANSATSSNSLFTRSESQFTPNSQLTNSTIISVVGGPLDTNLMNITFTFNGTASQQLLGQQNLGTFSLFSTIGPSSGSGRRAFTGAGFIRDLNPNVPNNNITTYVAPAIPEPSEWAFAGFAGMSVLGLVVRARKNKMPGVKNTGIATA